MPRHELRPSERKPMRDAQLIGPAHPDERLSVSLVLRRQNLPEMQKRLEQLHQGERLAPMTREDFAAAHGASASDFKAVKSFAAAHRLDVTIASAGRRTVNLEGTVADFEAAFGVTLQNYAHPNGIYRGREGTVSLPDELKDIVQAVLGLDNRPSARAHFRRAPQAQDNAAPAAPVSYAPTDLADYYGFKTGKRGAGQTIGIIELGGGSTQADFNEYFASLGFIAPKLISVSVDQAANQPAGSATGPDGEVMLDLEVAGAVAPCATLVAYFAPISDAGFLDAVTTAIHDTQNRPSVISISWGAPEINWTAQSITAFDEAFQDAAIMGITVCVASGDHGSSDGESDGKDHVNFPASSPHALACGGTSLAASNGAITDETVWNDAPNPGASGGGISTAFPTVPVWQRGLSAALTAGGTAPLTGRGVPDVAGDADPQTGYKVRVDGTDTVIGGTSAVAPFWAGLIARMNAERGTPLGFINPLLYANKDAFRDITAGNNGTYAATPGWDAPTGLGSPDGEKLWVRLGAAHTVQENALLARGNSIVARGGSAMTKIKDDALFVRGDDVVATGADTGNLAPAALFVRGDDVTATGGAANGSVQDVAAATPSDDAPSTAPTGSDGLEPDALFVRGD